MIYLKFLILYRAACFTFIPETNLTLIEVIEKKNSQDRYSLNLEKINTRFTPEDPNYYSGLAMESWWAVLLSFISFLAISLSIYFRMRYGYFGGKKLKNSEFTQTVRWTPGFLLVLSFLLFFISGCSLLIESQKITDSSNNLKQISEEFSSGVYSSAKYLSDNLIVLNMMHATDGLYFNTKSLQKINEEVNSLVLTGIYFDEDLQHLNNQRVIITLVMFCLGFILFFIGVLSFLLKIESLSYSSALSLGVLTALSCLVLIPYTMQRTVNLDFCEQIIECDLENSLPVQGHELGYYFSDFSQDCKSSLSSAEADLGSLLNLTSSSLPQPSKGLDYSIAMNSLTILRQSKEIVVKLSTSFFIKKLCKDVNTKICSHSFSSFIVSDMIILTLFLSLSLGFISGLLAPRVIERWKYEQDSVSLSKHNLYQSKPY